MATSVHQYEVTVAPGSTKAVPVETATNFPAASVELIEVYIPNGVVLKAGIFLAYAHAQIIPTTRGLFLTGDNVLRRFWFRTRLDGGAWSVFAYNTGIFSHTFYVTFHVNDFGLAQATVAPALTPLFA